QAFCAGYFNCEKECCETLEGSVPLDLKGTYFRNGYGKFEIGTEKQKVIHPFDSDGMVLAAQFADGKVLFRNRFVRTEGYLKERDAKRVLFRNSFGTQRKGGFLRNMFDLKSKNLANTNVLYRGGALYALWEGGLPHRLEADSLATVAADTLGGRLSPGGLCTAHPRVDARTGRAVLFTREPSDISRFSVREFNEDMTEHSSREFKVEGTFPFFHDFVVTDNYYIFDLAPTTFDPVPFLLGFKGPASCIGFDDSAPSKLLLVPRGNPAAPVIQIPVDTHFNFHYANAYDEGPGCVIFDVVKSTTVALSASDPDPEVPVWNQIEGIYEDIVPYSQLERYRLTKTAEEEGGDWRVEKELLSPNLVEFTSVSPEVSCKKHRYVYGVSSPKLGVATPFRSVIKVDTETRTQTMWTGEAHEFVGEPIFLPRDNAGPEEDDGYVVMVLWNGRERVSHLVVFDARDIAKGPVSRLPLPTALPFGLHGTWAPGLVYDGEAVRARFEATAEPL
ncbi:unnamed protein product, partial [Heterosigma akashiwo]